MLAKRAGVVWLGNDLSSGFEVKQQAGWAGQVETEMQYHLYALSSPKLK